MTCAYNIEKQHHPVYAYLIIMLQTLLFELYFLTYRINDVAKISFMYKLVYNVYNFDFYIGIN